jgi:hypothetical protein
MAPVIARPGQGVSGQDGGEPGRLPGCRPEEFRRVDMPQYVQPEVAQANLLDARADNYHSVGETAASNSDGYIRSTVYLASVLFLVGISSHFRVRGARTAVITVGAIILVFLHRFADPGAQTTALTRTSYRVQVGANWYQIFLVPILMPSSGRTGLQQVPESPRGCAAPSRVGPPGPLAGRPGLITP